LKGSKRSWAAAGAVIVIAEMQLNSKQPNSEVYFRSGNGFSQRECSELSVEQIAAQRAFIN